MLRIIPILVYLMTFCSTAGAAEVAKPLAERHFVIEIADEQSGRGVPLVELRTVSNVRFWSDSGGLVTIDDADLLGQKVFFYVESPGYEFPADGFGFHGKAIELTPGGSTRLKIKRHNIAERLYRVTGSGIYRDTIMAGKAAPIQQPLLNAQVVGQDSVQTIIYHDRIYWFWGDTNRPSYPLGHFGMSGATSLLPGRGGLDPAVGIDLTYFVDKAGFSRPMVNIDRPGPKWVDALMLVKDDKGQERMVGKYQRMKDLGHVLERGLVIFNDQSQMLDVLEEFPLGAPLYPNGQPLLHEEDGIAYYYFATPYPTTRVRADLETIKHQDRYEAFRCFKAHAHFDAAEPQLDRDVAGNLIWGWKIDAAPMSFEHQQRLIKSGKISAADAWFATVDAQTKKPVHLHAGSVAWNAYRKRWIMIANEVFGGPSNLGEVYYSEAEAPQGPWRWARKVVTHDRYSFYNPVHHPFFDQQGGRFIYFEGTYTGTFSRKEDLTPRYDYNQILYRLDLSDSRLTPGGEANGGL